MAHMQIESIRVHLHPDGQTSGTRSARLVGIGSCVRFETDDDSSVGLVRGFKYDEGVLHGKLQVFEGASDVLPISHLNRHPSFLHTPLLRHLQHPVWSLIAWFSSLCKLASSSQVWSSKCK